MALVRARVRISGRVQGVNFRYYTQEKANQLHLTGWVRNMWNGDVEAIFEGEKDGLEAMIDWCRIGPSMARVENVEVTYETATGEIPRFRIKL